MGDRWGAGQGARQGEGLEPLPKKRGVCVCVFGEGMRMCNWTAVLVYADTCEYLLAFWGHMCTYAPHVCVDVCVRVDLLMATCICVSLTCVHAWSAW